jgi:pteridine reductase
MNIVLHYNASCEEAEDLCDELNRLRSHSAMALQADLSLQESGIAMIEQAAKAWGRLDVLVNNASRYYRTPIGGTTEYAWDDLMTSNLKAPYFLAQAAVPHLAVQQGLIVNITDIQAEQPVKDYGVYCISKSSLVMMTKVLAKELGPAIRVNAVAPGKVMWPEGENAVSAAEKQKIIDRIALGRSGTPNDIAKAVLYFVRDAEYVTGQVLSVDGGRSLFGG